MEAAAYHPPPATPQVGPIVDLVNVMFTASAAAAAPVGTTEVSAPPPPAAPGEASSEDEAAAAEAERSRQANAAADAVTKVLDQVSIGLANSLQPGDPPVTIAS